MPGLLADVNVQGHLPYLRRLIDGLGLLAVLSELGLVLVTFEVVVEAVAVEAEFLGVREEVGDPEVVLALHEVAAS